MSDAEHYQVLARKYRPQTFSQLTGQEHVRRTLQNAIDSGRIAHAFLFTGARGVGKTSTARILARALNCEKGISVEPCNVCPQCLEIREGTSTDVFEIDGASNTGVDDIRELRDNVRYLPSHSRFKIFIIDEVHMLTNNAFNALLKTLEEPPSHVKFIFATTEPHKLPVTILSRCQRLDFKRVAIAAIVGRLREIATQEVVEVSDSALALIARKGDGSMRDSLTAFDQVLSFCGATVQDEDVVTMIGAVDRRLLFSLSEALFGGDTQRVLEVVKQVDGCGYNLRQFNQELLDHFRNLLVIRSVGKPEEILDLTDAELEELRRQSAGSSPQDIQRRLTLLLKADGEMAFSSFQRLVLEVALLKAAMLAPVIPIAELLERVKMMQTSAVHTPNLPWEAGKSVPAGRAVERPAPPVTPTAPSGASPAPPPRSTVAPAPPVAEAPAAEHRPAPSAGHRPLLSHADWEAFIQFAVAAKPATGSVLEHGSPLKLEPGLLELGFPEGGYFLMAAGDADSIKDAEELTLGFTGIPTAVKIKAITPETGAAALSIAEKKKFEQQQKLDKLKDDVESHPVIQEATRIFGGTITDIREQ